MEEDQAPYVAQPYKDESSVILDWLIEFLATASANDRAWLLVQLQHHIPPFRDWLERRQRGDQR